MYFYTNVSLDAPKLQNTYGDLNAVINYLIDGGTVYDVTKIEEYTEKANCVKVYFEAASPFVQFQTIDITGSTNVTYNTQMFIENVNTVENYFVCYNSNFNGTLPTDETTNIKMKIHNAGFTRKFGGIADNRTVIKFAQGMEFRIDDRDWRPLVTPPVTVESSNENWLKVARLSMSSNYDSLDSAMSRTFPYNSSYPNLVFQPSDKKIGSSAYIQYSKTDTIFYITQSTEPPPTEMGYKIFADEHAIYIATNGVNEIAHKFLYSFGEFERLNTNIQNGYMYCMCDNGVYGLADYDSDAFGSSYYASYASYRNFFETMFERGTNLQCSVIYDGGNGSYIDLVRAPEFYMAPIYSGYYNSRSLRNTNGINGGTYFSDVILSDNNGAGNYQIYGKFYNFKWICTNVTGSYNGDGKIYIIDNEYHYSHIKAIAASDYGTNLIKLTRM